MAFIAAYDIADPDDYERRMVEIARTWLSIMKAKHSVQGIVNRILDEFTHPTPDDYGSGWIDLKKQFTDWAIAEEWATPAQSDGTFKRKPTRRAR